MNLLLTPAIGQISAQVDAVLRHDADAVVIGIRAQAAGQWPDRISVQGREFALAWCPSPLVVRQKLLECEEATDGGGMVILTPLDAQALGSDVLARFSRGRLFAVDSWDMLRNVFQAREIDSRLARWPWLAEVLLENLPASGYPPVPGGFLDVDSAWAHGLRIVLDLCAENSARPGLPAVLKWSLEAERVHRYLSLSDHAKDQVTGWLGEVLGGSGKLALRGIAAGFAAELVPLGLICGVVFYQDAERSPELLAAAVRLERYFGGVPVSPEEARSLYRSARTLLDGLEPITLDRVLEVGDRLFQSLHLSTFTHISDDLPGSFEARLIKLGEALRAYLENSSTDTAAAVDSAVDHAARHRLAAMGTLRKLRMEMAAKLVRRLEQEHRPAQSVTADLAGSVGEYIRDGAFIDRARLSLLGGDELPGLTQSYQALRERVRALRERQNSRFAESLYAWQGTGCGVLPDVVPVERILAEIVAPLARQAPVLVLVMDGLSYPIFLEIVDDALKCGWTELLPIGRARPYAGLATIPSVTGISRASLLCGRLCSGQMAQEKAGFSSHPDLTTLSRSSAKPMVFHKGEITDGMGLSEEVRNAVGTPERKIVAVVYNAVDDHLSGSDQLQPHWNLDTLRLIRPLLYEARLGGRVVVVTSDHGHVLDESTVAGGSGIGDRWRSPEPESGPQEKCLEGGRVLTPTGETRVVVPWTESLRYGPKKNGYHGGISLQEMVVPIGILTPPGIAPPAAYRQIGPSFPEWWERTVPAAMAVPIVPARLLGTPLPIRKTKKPAASDRRQENLFGEVAEKPPQRSGDDWIASLLASSLYQNQRQLAARATLKDEEIRALLEALAERGGKLSKAALAQRLNLPLMRVSGFINAARRLLNVDQASVLSLDETEGSVTLNRDLLDTQFREDRT